MVRAGASFETRGLATNGKVERGPEWTEGRPSPRLKRPSTAPTWRPDALYQISGIPLTATCIAKVNRAAKKTTTGGAQKCA